MRLGNDGLLVIDVRLVLRGMQRGGVARSDLLLLILCPPAPSLGRFGIKLGYLRR